MTHLKTRGPMRLFCDLLVVSDAEIISLLDEFPMASFFVFFLPLVNTSDDILSVNENGIFLHLYLHNWRLELRVLFYRIRDETFVGFYGENGCKEKSFTTWRTEREKRKKVFSLNVETRKAFTGTVHISAVALGQRDNREKSTENSTFSWTAVEKNSPSTQVQVVNSSMSRTIVNCEKTKSVWKARKFFFLSFALDVTAHARRYSTMCW